LGVPLAGRSFRYIFFGSFQAVLQGFGNLVGLEPQTNRDTYKVLETLQDSIQKRMPLQ
jgi:hypothetical protein